ncbi:MAG TPA: tRNA dihydrouridine synthase DusB [Methylomirabilota bacterium]|nr:tRNA dihydrouridine synthase DusB [Methylomirabilota bacterium]
MSALDLRLAPMAGITNAPFRLVCRECGAGPLTSEEIDARALVLGNGKTEALAHSLPEERPIAMQLLGADPDVLAEAARRLETAGTDGIDLNMGCPVAKIVAKGQGSALMRDPLAAAVVFRTLRKAVQGPFTIKIRGGWDERTLNAVEIARLAECEGVDAITVHPRTRSQQFTGRAPWDIIAAVVAAVRIPVVGNGDVRSVENARAMMAATGCAAVMIGRGALGAPWIFGGAPVARAARAAIIQRHCALIEAHLPARLALVQLKKHLAWYSAGLPGSAALRPRLFTAASPAEARDLFWTLWTA